MPCIPMASLSQADRQEGQISPRLSQFLLKEGRLEKSTGSSFWRFVLEFMCIHTYIDAHTKNIFIKIHPDAFCQVYPRFGYVARKLISGIAGLAK